MGDSAASTIRWLGQHETQFVTEGARRAIKPSEPRKLDALVRAQAVAILPRNAPTDRTRRECNYSQRAPLGHCSTCPCAAREQK
jgi:hypothetical protein